MLFLRKHLFSSFYVSGLGGNLVPFYDILHMRVLTLENLGLTHWDNLVSVMTKMGFILQKNVSVVV